MQCMPQLEYKDYIAQGGGQTAHLVQRPRPPLFTPGGVVWVHGRVGVLDRESVPRTPP